MKKSTPAKNRQAASDVCPMCGGQPVLSFTDEQFKRLMGQVEEGAREVAQDECRKAEATLKRTKK